MRRRPIAEINVVPYIDVMLVLLVIFMITSPLLTQGINVKLPQAKVKALPAQQETPIIISINNHGNYFLNISDDFIQPVSTKELITRVAAALQLAKQKHQQREIYVKGDNEVNYGKVVQMMALLKQAGASGVGLLTQNSPQ
ncbi:MAG: protein TolR [Coxiella-like endosymbiont]|uniref:protein TolR n=1 Tax=Coxiella-like endosymbiont TaxID=1592897 RepID=UPI00215A2B9C|nr:protein TolR [Coxiella-like endosymbiont]UVE59392.1 protein TolR [Coxiella-like endosymbiont]